MSLPNRFRRGSWLIAGVLLLGLAAGGEAVAHGNERGGGWLRSYVGPQERHLREPQTFAPEPMRRQDPDDARNARRLSSEERRQLRRDVHDAGRDVYGNPPRRLD